MSRKGDPRYQPLVLPALRHLDYLVINELEAGEFSGLEIRDGHDALNMAHIADAATQLLAAGVRQRVVIHCPEGAWGEAPGEKAMGSVVEADAGRDYRQRRRGRRVLRGLLYGCHESLPLTESIYWRTPARRASLLAANATDGAKTLAELQAFIQENGQAAFS